MIHHGDCLEVMPTLPAESVDSIVTDPPYGLSFMGKNWDHGIPGESFWREALRIAKPGTHLLAFGGTRTFHRLTCAIEDAGWEIRDCVMWVYGSGFPKSLNVAKAIESGSGRPEDIRRMQLGDDYKPSGRGRINYDHGSGSAMDAGFAEWQPATPAAQQWQGWGTALKPAWEPIIVARKPLKGTVAQNVQAYGTGAVNVDAARIYTNEKLIAGGSRGVMAGDERKGKALGMFQEGTKNTFEQSPLGRWPANLIHDGSDEVVGLFPETEKPCGRPNCKGRKYGKDDSQVYGNYAAATYEGGYLDSGSAARFFYCAKASKADRDEGCEGLGLRDGSVGDRRPSGSMSQRIHADEGRPDTKSRNYHPTVKPTSLMRYLCRFVTPPGGTVLDPFCGSGSTGKAATLEGFEFIGIEREAEYVEIARARIAHARGDMPLLEAVR